MQSRAEILMELPENVLSVGVQYQTWNGMTVEVAEEYCEGRVVHQLGYGDKHRLLIVLAETGGSLSEPRLRPDRPSTDAEYSPTQLNLVPAGMELWGYSEDIRYLKAATFIFDLTQLESRLNTRIALAADEPRFRFADDRAWVLMKLLTDAVGHTDPSAQLYGDSLTAAIAALVLNPNNSVALQAGGLAPRQLRSVLDYLYAHLPQRVELSALAALTGMSQSHFSRAFKASTGLAPYQWQLTERIRLARHMLEVTPATIDQVATATGFTDAVHFGRAFRKNVGASPGAWRRARRS